MKFSEIEYRRPSIDAFEASFDQLLTDFKNAEALKEQNEALMNIAKLRDDFDTMFQLSNIKFSRDTEDKSIEKEVEYFNEVMPRAIKMTDQFYAVLNEAKFKDGLIDRWGEHIFNLSAYEVKGFDPAIIEEMKEQSKLTKEYMKLKSSAKIDFDGEVCNLTALTKHAQSEDRETRKRATVAGWDFFADNQAQFDRVFDDLVKVRHQMALKLGYENFVDLGYVWMGRMDYTKESVAQFRQQVVAEIVPIVSQLKERQRVRLGYEALEDYDHPFMFLSGNPTPKGTAEEIFDHAKKMYKELSVETDTFFKYMLEYDLMDVTNRNGKAGGGYAWWLSNYKHPFIFANFNGTAHDIDVLTHEAGHAFQYFQSRNYDLIEYRSTKSPDTAEIHSMSMEFFTYPWMEGFFKEDTEKYYFAHLSKCLNFLPYGCAVDHFQQIVYENPQFTPDERANAWKELQDIYLPSNKHNVTPYIESGRYWQRQSHIYQSPFYYIDYVLAQICAFQFWLKAKDDRATAWEDYLRLCNAGGTGSFLQLVELANLKSPFDPDCLKGITAEIASYLDCIDDSKF